MRTKRVLVYGGTELDRKTGSFVTALACRLLENETIKLMTGGFERAAETPSGVISTDVAAADGARKYAREHGLEIDDCIETWLPDPRRDRPEDQVERFRAGKSEVMRGLSDQARRLKLVQMADALVTVHGEVRTALVLEMSLAVGRPALPLAFTGGDSGEHWSDNRSYYVARLGITEAKAQQLESFKLATAGAPDVAACIDAIADTVGRVISRTCLVLMPFRSDLDDEYTSLTAVVEAEGFHPIRLDRELYAGDVRETVVRLLRESDAVIADVTGQTANVMYEVGLAHALGRKPLLLWRGDAALMAEVLPFYLRPQRVATGSSEVLENALKSYLREARSGL